MPRPKRVAPRVVMSDEQFERLLAAIQATPHVCPPCYLPHYPYLQSYRWWWDSNTFSTTSTLKEG